MSGIFSGTGNRLGTANKPLFNYGTSTSTSTYNNKAPTSLLINDVEKAIIPFLWGYALISVLLSLSIWRNFYTIATEKKKTTLEVGKIRLVLSIIIIFLSPILTGIYTFTHRRAFKMPLYIYFTIAYLIQFLIIATI